ncbi:hypothetical protein SB757_35420, partial [Pseudomonas sp. SIMBA_065]
GLTVQDFLDSLKGDTGASAYEVWEGLAGNAGKTEAEFIEAITGPQGIVCDAAAAAEIAFEVGRQRLRIDSVAGEQRR